MQAPEDNSVTVVEPHGETYADSNLNEKNLGTKYIYTTEGELIPADEDHNTSNVDLNAQHYNSNHVTAPQTVNIHQVDFQFEQQYPEGTGQVVSVNTEFVQNQANSFVLEPAEYGPESAEPVPNADQVYSTGVATEPQAPTFEYSASTEVGGVYTPEQPVGLKTSVKDELVTTTLQTSNQSAENGQVSDEAVKLDDALDQVSDDSAEQVGGNIAGQTVESSTEDNHSKEDESKATTLSTNEDETDIQNLKSNPAIEIQTEENADAVEEAKSAELESNETSTEEIITLEQETEGQEEYIQDISIAVESEVTYCKKPTPSRPRGRKVKTDIPLHILGHDVNKPMDNILNGKTPKPRLGVKVPYRNLTSQIVTKTEIEQEIIERGKKKQEDKKDLVCTKLTSRLAKKIAMEAEGNARASDINKKQETTVLQESQTEADNDVADKSPKTVIDNNTDLLAILEGDGDTEATTLLPDPIQSKESNCTDETNLKNLEREIALQQLQDLPFLSPKTKYIKSNKFKVYSKGSLSGQKTEGKSASEKSGATAKLQTPKSPIKSNMAKLEVGRPKMNMALKTYSRKRKSTDAVAEPLSPTKKPNVVSSTVDVVFKSPIQSPASDAAYVTKSSRVIKRKVIWDPDEAIPKVKASVPKAETTPSPKLSLKTVQPKNENKSADQPKKAAVEVKTKTERKVEDKRSSKKITIGEKKTSPAPAKPVQKLKKPRSEVDKLLGDEGAIKMLYDLKNSENFVEEKRRKTVISVEKTFKDLAKKANQIKSDLVNTSSEETPKSLRKKEPLVSTANQKSAPPVPVQTVTVPGGISRQKSKDSARSTPPPSPAFSYPNEVSYLIRRRSSSSISSSADDIGGAIDLDESEDSPSKKKPVTVLTDPLSIKPTGKSPELLKSQKRTENRMGHYKTFNLRKVNNSVTIELHPTTSKTYFTSELLHELSTALTKVSKENDCHVVLIKSCNAAVFSSGIDYKSLVSDKENIRKQKAKELANQVKTFLKCLMDFPKVLVAGIQGECKGLAVTILPLFDIVIASDDAQFSTSYSSLGCVAEGGFLLAVPYVSSYGLAGELLLASQKLTADEAYRRGLISKLCWPEKYQDTVRTTMAAVSQGSRQSLEATKKNLRINFKVGFEQTVESMELELIEHWISAECQANFNNLD